MSQRTSVGKKSLLWEEEEEEEEDKDKEEGEEGWVNICSSLMRSNPSVLKGTEGER